jgi:hypothetical protein
MVVAPVDKSNENKDTGESVRIKGSAAWQTASRRTKRKLISRGSKQYCAGQSNQGLFEGVRGEDVFSFPFSSVTAR